MWRGEHQSLILMVLWSPVTASNLQEAFVLLKDFFLFMFVRGSGLSVWVLEETRR